MSRRAYREPSGPTPAHLPKMMLYTRFAPFAMSTMFVTFRSARGASWPGLDSDRGNVRYDPLASINDFFRLTIALLMIGAAQNPTVSTHPNVTYKNAMPTRRPKWSAIRPMIRGTTAPPMIPVLKIPANDP